MISGERMSAAASLTGSQAEDGLRSVWMLPAAIGALCASVAMVYWPTTRSLYAEWSVSTEQTYAHGLLILAICAWLLVRRRSELAAAVIRIDLRFALASALLSMLWLIAYRAGLQVVHQALLPVLALAGVFTAFGRDVARRCWFTFAYLFVAVPIWSVGNPVLQSATVVVVRTLLKTLGVSALVVDNMVRIPSGVFEIASGCSGLQFFVVAIAIAALYGELQDDSVRVRAVQLLLAAVLAMVGNWVRVFTIIMAGYLTDMQHFLVQVDHYYFGWAVFAVAITVFFIIVRRLPWSAHHEAPAAAAKVRPREKSFVTIGVAAAILGLSAGPFWALASPATLSLNETSSILPVNPEHWVGPRDYSGPWRPQYLTADLIEHGVYLRAGREVAAYAATYLSQRQNKELISFDTSVLGDSPWRVIASGERIIAGERLNELEVEDAQGGTRLIWYYYEIGASRTARGLLAQLTYAIASLAATPTSRIVAASAACEPDCLVARADLAAIFSAFEAVSAVALAPRT